MVDNSLTIIVPALNEGDKLRTTIDEIVSAVKSSGLNKWEIVIVDDGSTDNTGEVAERLAAQYTPSIFVHRHESNLGVGSAYKSGLQRSTMSFITLIPGDNTFKMNGLKEMFAAVGSVELIISYRTNMEVRKLLRKYLSKLATFSVWLLSGVHVKDAHSVFVFPVKKAQSIKISTGYGYHLESLCSLLQMCSSFKEIPIELNPKPDLSSGVMKPRALFKVSIAVLGLVGKRIKFLIRKKGNQLKFTFAGKGRSV